MTRTDLDTFRRHVNAAASALASVDRRGRNADGSWSCAEYHGRLAGEVLGAACQDESSQLPEYLDSPRGERLAAKWSGVERRLAGLPV